MLELVQKGISDLQDLDYMLVGLVLVAQFACLSLGMIHFTGPGTPRWRSLLYCAGLTAAPVAAIQVVLLKNPLIYIVWGSLSAATPFVDDFNGFYLFLVNLIVVPFLWSNRPACGNVAMAWFFLLWLASQIFLFYMTGLIYVVCLLIGLSFGQYPDVRFNPRRIGSWVMVTFIALIAIGAVMIPLVTYLLVPGGALLALGLVISHLPRRFYRRIYGRDLQLTSQVHPEPDRYVVPKNYW